MYLLQFRNILLNVSTLNIINIPSNIQEHMCKNNIIIFSTSTNVRVNFNCPQTIYTTLSYDVFQPESNYGFIVKNLDKLEEIMIHNSKNLYFNFKALSVIFISKHVDILDVFAMMWKYYLSPIVVGVRMETTIDFHLWNPLQEDNQCGRKISVLKLEDSEAIDHYIEKFHIKCTLRAKYSLMLPGSPQVPVLKQMENNFRKFYNPVNISLVVLPGTENSSLMNSQKEWDFDYLINTMNADEFDLVLGFFFLLNEKHLAHGIQQTEVYLHTFGGWIFPLRRIAFWKMIASTFSVSTWLCLGVIILLCTLTTSYVLPYKSSVEILLDLYRFLLGGSSSIGLENEFRVLLLIEILFCFYINLFFQAKLSSMLSVPLYENIQNTEDLLNTDMKMKLISSVFREMPKNIVKRSEEYKTYSEDFIMEDLEKTMDFATAVTDLYIKKYKLPGVRFFRQSSIIICTYIRRGHYLLDSFNRIIRYSHEYGFITKHINSALEKEISADVPKIALSKLKEFFVILFIGLATAFGIFICEVYVGFLNRRKNNQS